MSKSATHMLVTNVLEASPSGGRQLLSKLNHNVLQEIYGDELRVTELAPHGPTGIRQIVASFQGYIDGLTPKIVRRIIEEIRRRRVQSVFVDGSNLGLLVKALKQAMPAVRATTFFHNVEARFFLGAARESKSARSLAVLAANFVAERQAVKYSDQLICLNWRDANLLERLYGRRGTDVAPMALRDQLEGDSLPSHRDVGDFALFVGGAFYANRAGVAWFAENVVPRTGIKLRIVGRGFEAYRAELECFSGVEVIGAVDSLAPWYAASKFVVAPIFDGSGMKTKIAEALMHGKKVIGTPEAFVGYEHVAGKVGWTCRTADDFVTAMAEAKVGIDSCFDPQLRRLYEENYSFEAARNRLERLLGRP